MEIEPVSRFAYKVYLAHKFLIGFIGDGTVISHICICTVLVVFVSCALYLLVLYFVMLCFDNPTNYFGKSTIVDCNTLE